MNLLRQGYYREMPHGEETDPSIKDFINLEDGANIDKICRYLEQGIVIITCAGTVDDVINPQNGIAGIPSMLTDGKWVWSGDLSYYVRNYMLKLDDEFLKSMRDNDWKVQITFEELNFDEISIEGDFIFR